MITSSWLQCFQIFRNTCQLQWTSYQPSSSTSSGNTLHSLKEKEWHVRFSSTENWVPLVAIDTFLDTFTVIISICSLIMALLWYQKSFRIIFVGTCSLFSTAFLSSVSAPPEFVFCSWCWTQVLLRSQWERSQFGFCSKVCFVISELNFSTFVAPLDYLSIEGSPFSKW